MKKIEFDDIPESLVKGAMLSGLTINSISNVSWFIYDNVAIGGLLLFNGKTARLVSIYVDPAYRKNDIGTCLTEKLIERAKEMGKKRLTVITNNPKWYMIRNWKVLFKAKLDGYIWMELTT